MARFIFKLKFGTIIKKIVKMSGLPENLAEEYVKFFYVEDKKDLEGLRKILHPYFKEWTGKYVNGKLETRHIFQLPNRKLVVGAVDNIIQYGKM